MKRFALAILLAGSVTGAHALDLHPLQSLTLAVPADGRFDFDSVDIPAGVILRFAAWDDAAGARPLLDFQVAGNTHIGGGILATPYDLAFSTAGTFILESGAFLSVTDGGVLRIASTGNGGQISGTLITDAGSVTLIAGNDLTAPSLLRNAGSALVQLSSGGDITLSDTSIQQPVPEADTWAMLLAGLGVVGYVARRRQRTRLAALR